MERQESPSADQVASQELRRTMIFALVAAVCLGITGMVHWLGSPDEIEEFGKVGQIFYPKFEDPTLATALEVFTWSAKDARPQQFRVEQQENGRWVIPSRHDYPADAKEQLAKTAASILGIKRGAMVTRWSTDHKKYGVVDPKQDSITVSDVEGIGSRIILEGEDGDLLADFIVGNSVEDSPNEYYVRHPDEEEVYMTNLDIDLTTKFSDWIDDDLFDVQSTNIVNVAINDYTIDEIQGAISKSELTTIHRDKSADPWKMEGLIEEKDEVNSDSMRDTLDAIRDLKIVGVRPKQKGLTPELRLDRAALKSQSDFARMQNDLLSRGFVLQPGPGGDQNNLQLIAREGEMQVATDDGLVYAMFFGRVFTGSQKELEIGFGDNSTNEESGDDKAKEETEKTEESSDNDDSTSDNADTDQTDVDEENGDDEEESSTKPGRYVFVRVFFDKTFLGEEIIEPTEPEMPAELKDAPAPVEGEEDPLKEVRDAYSDAQVAYQTGKRSHEDYVEKIKDGLKKSEELNRRFAEWYYVISGEEYDKLNLARADYIREKSSDDAEPATPDGASPGFSIPGSVVPGGVELPIPPPAEPDGLNLDGPVQPDVKPVPSTDTGDPAGPTKPITPQPTGDVPPKPGGDED